MRILFTADWHFDIKNLDLTVPAAERLETLARNLDIDYFVHGGDLVVHRGAIHPHVSYHLRRVIKRIVDATRGNWGAVLMGNHDDSYNETRADSVTGVFGDTDAGGFGLDWDLALVSRPDVLVIGNNAVALAMIPSPNKYHLAKHQENHNETLSAEALLVDLVRAQIAEARAEVGPEGRVIVVYHGTIRGCTLGNEQSMPAGADTAVPPGAFIGADLVLAGHIHEPQEFTGSATGPKIVYAGAIAPLNWGEKRLVPRALMVDVTPLGITVESWELPVVSQMMEHRIDIADATDGQSAVSQISDFLTSVWQVSGAPVGRGDRVRLVVRGPRAALDAITRDAERTWKDHTGARDLIVVKEFTDDAVVRFELPRAWTMADAMRRWLGFRGIDADSDEHRRIMECAEEIERLVTDEHLDAHYDFDPVRLRMKNWCQYPDITLEFGDLERVVAVAGPNAGGKSNLMRALVWMLYRKQLTGRGLASLIRNGEKKMEGTLEFRVNGRDYMIVRALTRTGDGGAEGVLSLMTRDAAGSPWYLVNEGTATETQRAIETLVGPWQLFAWTVYAGQNAVDALVDLTPAEMKDVLIHVLQRNFADRERIAGEHENRLATEAARQRAAAEVLGTSHRTPSELTADIEAERGRLAEVPGDPDTGPLEQELADARLAAASAAQAAQRRTDALRAEGEAEVRLIAAQKAVAAAAKARDEAAEKEAALGPEPGTADLQAAAEEARREPGKLREARRGFEAGARAGIQEARGKLDAAHRELRLAQGNRDTAERTLADARREAELLGGVPCGGKRWTPMPTAKTFENLSFDDPVDMSACRFLGRASAAAASIATYETNIVAFAAAVGVAEATVDEADREVAALNADLDAMISRYESEEHEAERHADAAQAALREAQARHRVWSQAAQGVAVLRERAAGLPAAQEALSDANMVHSRAQAAVRANSGSDVDQANRNMALAQKRLDAARKTIDESRAWRESIRGRIAGLEHELTLAIGARRRVADINGDAELAETLAAAWRVYRAAMQRDGLPFLLLESYAIPQLRERANAYLARTNFRITVDSLRETQAGKLRNEVVISFEDARGSHDLSSASGFQRTALGMALRAALADLHAAATGATLRLAIQDEGFGTMTPENMDAAHLTVRAIAEARQWFFVISHVGGLSESADSVLRVADHGAFSTVEVE